MKIKDIRKVIDPLILIWINQDNFSELYDNIDDVPDVFNESVIDYITTDNLNYKQTITIELESELPFQKECEQNE